MSPTFVRVEKGHAEPEEVAALTAALLARAAAHHAPARGRRARAKAGWRRLERTAGFRSPCSWQG
ncbi:acyl-CoA carboxylase epsilon subunit [Streptomyces sp. NBC_01304]|uniref:acyl-CoA carboxylase epsilon subunit n=1 Tax=Streptomyces sp. NBC_01304 TaxID=2903818 RepID=UPI002E14E243|nr:acyl-CoA carboxylase subunit epsilon [Streptomyces sp. NBC_01304]